MIRILPLLVFAVVGCAEEKDAAPSLAISAEAIDFGEVSTDAASTLSFTVENAGGGSISLLSVSLIEGRSTIFEVSRSGDDTLTAGASTTVEVTFTPAEVEAYEGRLQVRTDSESDPNRYVSLDGSGGLSNADNDGDGYSPAEGDCDDTDATRSPGATESCDGLDNDCDGALPANETDADFDGWMLCEEDCDDDDSNVYPGAEEICDDKDSDCDGFETDRLDEDDDGYSICDGDCDDEEPLASPGLSEVCDEIDNDCSGRADDIDEDRDGHSPCGSAGDCDDDDASAYPVVVDGAATGKEDGTEAFPYQSLETALDNLDTVCRTVQMMPGSYEVSLAWNRGELHIGGATSNPSDVVLTPPKGSRVFDVQSAGELTLSSLTLSGAATSGDGGAVRVVGGILVLDGIVASDNSCSGDGGALAVSTGTATVYASHFARNLSEDDGGAVAVISGSFTDAEGSVYEDNSAVRGGALLLESTVADLADTIVTGNTATDSGGGLEAVGGTLRLERLDVTLNDAGTTGGGLSIVDHATASSVLRNLRVQDNAARGAGGGLSFSGTQAAMVLANSTFLANDSGGEGCGISANVASASALTIWSNVVAFCAGDSGIYSRSGNGASVASNLLYATSSGTNLSIDEASDGGGNLEDDPEFVDFNDNGDPDDDDLDFVRASPGVDSGPDEGTGPAGYTSWNDLDGSQNDRGHTGGQGAGG